jgi:hypothetical protein
MVNIDIKQLLRDERQRRITPDAAVAEQEFNEASVCSISGLISLDDFAVGADKLQVGATSACGAVRLAMFIHILV